MAPYSIHALGAFRLFFDGGRIDLPGRRAQALLAMLASSAGGERTRVWLQDRLWGSRPLGQAQASLRRELSSLRKLVNRDGRELLGGDHLRVWLDLGLVDIDIRNGATGASGEFLEGIDLPGEEGFEDWLRQERARWAACAAPAAPDPTKQPAAGQGVPNPAITDALSVLALNDMAGAEDVGDALAERFARVRWLRIATGAAAQAARFELAGQVRGDAGPGRTLALKLTDRTTGGLLWSARVPLAACEEADALGIDAVACAVRARIAQTEQAGAVATIGGTGDVATLIWRSQWHMHRLTRQDAATAAAFAEQALAADPHGVEPLLQAAWVRLWDLWVTRASESEIRNLRELTQRAIVADHEDARGHMLAGITEIWLMQPLRAEALLRRAVELDPGLVMARVQLGTALYLNLRPVEAEAELQRALQLSPNDQYLFFIAGELATASLMQHKWREALLYAETALAARRSYTHGHVAKCNALVRLDRIDEARAARTELLHTNPGYDPRFIDWIPFLDSGWNSFLKDGLNRAARTTD